MNLFLSNIITGFRKKEKAVRFVFIAFFIVGVLGVAAPPARTLFITLTPLALLLSFFVLLVFHQPESWKKEILVFLLIFIISFFIEAAGVSFGFIFGEYSYGSGLGLKIIGTPLMIGINWILLIYCTGAIFEKIRIAAIWQICGASLLMVLYDLIMEQVAPQMDMWTFEGGMAPFRNYIAWFILAFIFQSFLKLSGIRVTNKLASLVLYCQGAFFIILAIIFKFA